MEWHSVLWDGVSMKCLIQWSRWLAVLLHRKQDNRFIYVTCFIIINQLVLLRSSQLLLYQPVTRINFQSKAFSITAPAVWNSLSPVTKSSATITTFKAHLKTELFSAAYDIHGLTFLAAGASDLNSRHPAPPINVADIWHLTLSLHCPCSVCVYCRNVRSVVRKVRRITCCYVTIVTKHFISTACDRRCLMCHRENGSAQHAR